jgi:hypothetical protein
VGGIVARRVQDAVRAIGAVGPVQPSVSAAVVHHPVDGETGESLIDAALAKIAEAEAAGPNALLGLREA